MWIKKLYATFGKLDGKTLELSPGLNIVYGKNEAGKSTWSAFIKAMFYGISTRERSSSGFIPDKEKYLPWNGSPMYGKMELSTDEGDMTIERTSAKSGVFTKTTATYDENGREAPLGDMLVGVSANVYERTSFIRQSGIEVTGDKETERRILSIASSGDETISAGEVIDRLKKKQRALRSTTKNGELQKLEREIGELSGKISEARESEQEASRLFESVSAFKEEQARLKRSLAIALAEEEKNKLSYIEGARKSLSAALLKAQELETAPARRELDLFIQKKGELASLSLSDEQSEKLLNLAKEELSACRREIEQSVFCGMSADVAKETAKQDCKVLEEGKKSSRSFYILAAGFFALAAASVAGGILFSVLIFIATAFLAGVAVAMLILAGKNKEKASAARAIKEKYGAEDSAKILSDAEKYTELIGREGELAARESEAARAKADTDEKIRMRRADIKVQLSAFSIDDEDIFLAEEKLRALVEEREKAQRDVLAARARVEALDAAVEVTSGAIEYDESEIPENSPAYFEKEISEVSEKIRTFELALAAERTKLSGFSREDEEKKLSELRSREAEASFEYDALSVAIDTMDEAETELKNRFSPEVEKRTSEIFAYLTGGNFEIVRIKNSDFEVSVAKGEASTPHDGLMLSRGTLDELYFALRIALFETIIPEENAPPMILDDALVNFDDMRCERALSLLLEIAKERQIILFSCHSREANQLRDNAQVRKIEL